MEGDDKKLNPWLSIWLEPRYTMRTILDGYNRGPIILLAALGGIADALSRISEKNGNGFDTLFQILIQSFISGIIGGIIGIYFISLMLWLSGKWIGGEGKYDDILTAIGWANVPSIWSLIIWFLGIVVFGVDFFKDASYILKASIFLNIISWLFTIAFWIIGLWSIFVAIKCVAEVQQFSSWKAVLNFILAFLIVFVPLMIIVVLQFIG